LPLPERARKQTPHGIGAFTGADPPNTKHIGDDKGSDYSHTGREDRLCVGQSKLAA
jgi:hypothetical protein